MNNYENRNPEDATVAIWFAANEADTPMFTSMNRLHPLSCPVEEHDNPESWIDAYNMHTDPVAAIRQAFEDSNDTREMVMKDGTDVSEDNLSDFAPRLVVARVWPDGVVQFSQNDLLDDLCHKLNEQPDEIFYLAQDDELSAEIALEVMAEAKFSENDFFAEPQRIYDAYGARVPAIGSNPSPGM